MGESYPLVVDSAIRGQRSLARESSGKRLMRHRWRILPDMRVLRATMGPARNHPEFRD